MTDPNAPTPDPRDPELAEWRAEWQTFGDPAALAGLSDRCARDGRKLRRSLALETLGAAFSTVVLTALVVRTRGTPPVAAIAVALSIFNGVWLARYYGARWGLLAVEGSTVDRWIDLTRRRLAAEQALARFAWHAHVALFCVVIPGIVWLLVTHAEQYRRAPWRGVVGLGVAAGVHAVLFVVLRSRQRKAADERERFEALVQRTAM